MGERTWTETERRTESMDREYEQRTWIESVDTEHGQRAGTENRDRIPGELRLRAPGENPGQARDPQERTPTEGPQAGIPRRDP